MSRTQELGRRVALIVEARKLLDQAAEDTYAELAAEIRKGSLDIFATDQGVDDADKLGNFSVPTPSKRFVLDDESAAAAWAYENIGDSAVVMRLSTTGKNDVKAAVQKGLDVPWARISVETSGSPRFRPTPECGRLVRDLLARNVLSPSDLPQLGGAA